MVDSLDQSTLSNSERKLVNDMARGKKLMRELESHSYTFGVSAGSNFKREDVINGVSSESGFSSDDIAGESGWSESLSLKIGVPEETLSEIFSMMLEIGELHESIEDTFDFLTDCLPEDDQETPIDYVFIESRGKLDAVAENFLIKFRTGNSPHIAKYGIDCFASYHEQFTGTLSGVLLHSDNKLDNVICDSMLADIFEDDDDLFNEVSVMTANAENDFPDLDPDYSMSGYFLTPCMQNKAPVFVPMEVHNEASRSQSSLVQCSVAAIAQGVCSFENDSVKNRLSNNLSPLSSEGSDLPISSLIKAPFSHLGGVILSHRFKEMTETSWVSALRQLLIELKLTSTRLHDVSSAHIALEQDFSHVSI